MVINGVPSRERQRFRLPKIRHGCHTSYVSLVFLWMYKKQRKFNNSYDPCLFNTGTSMFYGKCNIQINCMRLSNVYFEHLQISSIEEKNPLETQLWLYIESGRKSKPISCRLRAIPPLYIFVFRLNKRCSSWKLNDSTNQRNDL